MGAITQHETQQIDDANASGRTPVVFVHGLWLLPSSWDRWRTVFEEAGYATLAPGWPDDPETVAEANAHPEVFAKKSIRRRSGASCRCRSQPSGPDRRSSPTRSIAAAPFP